MLWVFSIVAFSNLALILISLQLRQQEDYFRESGSWLVVGHWQMKKSLKRAKTEETRRLINLYLRVYVLFVAATALLALILFLDPFNVN